MSAEERLRELGIELPPPPTPAGLYAPSVRTGNLVAIAGQVPQRNGRVMNAGKLGRDVSIEDAAAAARQCSLQALAILRDRVGSLDNVVQAVRVAGYVASAEGFTDHPKVINGASQLLLDVFGEVGRAARIAIGVAELPSGSSVEVEYLFEVR